ncbi:hypothetical protein K502DRAFT_344044 [Neoconidiobolus thromboides FSU 785]|nr:hypothetical protein K502DRAFT_344044 [Neoconidiobolus thromboides FSU 785]
MGIARRSENFDIYEHDKVNKDENKKDLENLGILRYTKKHYHQRYLYESSFKYAIVLNYTEFVKEFLDKGKIDQLSNQMYSSGSSKSSFFGSNPSIKLSSTYDSNKELLIAKEIKILAQDIMGHMTKHYFTKATSIKHNEREKLVTFSFINKDDRDEQYINEVLYKESHIKLYRPFYKKDNVKLITVTDLPGTIVGNELENLVIKHYSTIGTVVYCKHNKAENLDIYSDSVTVVLATLGSITATTVNKELIVDGLAVRTSPEFPEVVYC